MNNYKFLIEKNNLNINKCEIKGKAIIIDTDDGKYVLKHKNNYKLFKYLESKKFYNYPKIIDYDRENGIYEYIDNIEYDNDEKALDLIRIVAFLHKKTSYYKEINNDEYKSIYEDIRSKIEYLYNYYIDFANVIENKVYMSPSEYLFIRNISKVFEALNFCKIEIDNFLELTKTITRKRVVTLHNNLDIDNMLRNDEIYLISFNSKTDIPIYDLVNFYKKRCLEFDFSILFNEYQKINHLEKIEKKLLSILISLPDKLILDDNEYNNTKIVSNFLDKIYKTEKCLNFEEKEESTDAGKSEYDEH